MNWIKMGGGNVRPQPYVPVWANSAGFEAVFLAYWDDEGLPYRFLSNYGRAMATNQPDCWHPTENTPQLPVEDFGMGWTRLNMRDPAPAYYTPIWVNKIGSIEVCMAYICEDGDFYTAMHNLGEPIRPDGPNRWHLTESAPALPKREDLT